MLTFANSQSTEAGVNMVCQDFSGFFRGLLKSKSPKVATCYGYLKFRICLVTNQSTGQMEILAYPWH